MSKKKESKRELVFADGTRVRVTGEKGKYWLCGEAQYRKGNPGIVGVEKEKDEETISPAEPDSSARGITSADQIRDLEPQLPFAKGSRCGGEDGAGD